MNIFYADQYKSGKGRQYKECPSEPRICLAYKSVDFFILVIRSIIFIWDDNTIDNSSFSFITVTPLPIETPRGVTQFITDLRITGRRGNRRSGKRPI